MEKMEYVTRSHVLRDVHYVPTGRMTPGENVYSVLKDTSIQVTVDLPSVL
jgi:hypothetical protein